MTKFLDCIKTKSNSVKYLFCLGAIFLTAAVCITLMSIIAMFPMMGGVTMGLTFAGGMAYLMKKDLFD